MKIFEEKQPRQKWLLGRINEMICSSDDAVRAAKVYLGGMKRIFERPINF